MGDKSSILFPLFSERGEGRKGEEGGDRERECATGFAWCDFNYEMQRERRLDLGMGERESEWCLELGLHELERTPGLLVAVGSTTTWTAGFMLRPQPISSWHIHILLKNLSFLIIEIVRTYQFNYSIIHIGMSHSVLYTFCNLKLEKKLKTTILYKQINIHVACPPLCPYPHFFRISKENHPW